MSEKVEQLILKRLTYIPGVVGIAPMNFDELARSLPKQEFGKGIQVATETSGIIPSIAIIIEHNINMKIVATEINNAIKTILLGQGIALNDLKIYVRGVK